MVQALIEEEFPRTPAAVADWLLRVFLVFISQARIRKDSQIKHNRSTKISKQHCKREGNVTKKPCKSPKGATLRSRTVKGKTADCISSSLTSPKLHLATFQSFENMFYSKRLKLSVAVPSFSVASFKWHHVMSIVSIVFDIAMATMKFHVAVAKNQLFWGNFQFSSWNTAIHEFVHFIGYNLAWFCVNFLYFFGVFF